jgi:hypothetical protein
LKIAEELRLLERAIEVCRSTIAYHEHALASVAGQPGEEAALALVKMYNDLLERQLARRAELLAEEGD